jgi:membrane protease YdiL (CAAX protease family)
MAGVVVLGGSVLIGWPAQYVNVAVGLWITEVPIFVGLSWLVLRSFERRPAEHVGLRLVSAWPVVLGFGLGLANFAALVIPIQALAQAVLPKHWLEVWSGARVLDGHRPWELATLVVGVSAAAPFCEEFFFRGVVLKGLLQAGAARAIVASALIFAVAHVNPVDFVALFELGLLFGVLFLRSGSIWPGVAAHAANNLVSVVIYFAAGPTRADDVPEPSAVLAFGAAGGMALLGLMWLANRFPRLLAATAPPPTETGTV